MWGTPSLPLLSGPPWLGLVLPVWVLSMGQIELFNKGLLVIENHRAVSILLLLDSCPVGWGCRIHWLLLYRGVRLPQRVSWYDIKQSDGKMPVILELLRMWSTPSLPLLPGPLWPEVEAFDRARSIDRIELDCNCDKLNCLK